MFCYWSWDWSSALSRRRCPGILCLQVDGWTAARPQARADAASIIEDAEREAETKRREADLAAKEAALKIKDDAEAEVRARRAEIARVEERLDNRDTSLERREGELDERRRRLTQTEEAISRAKQEELRERAGRTPQGPGGDLRPHADGGREEALRRPGVGAGEPARAAWCATGPWRPRSGPTSRRGV